MTELYVELKQIAAEELRLARDALHIYGGFLVFVAILFAARTRRPEWWMVLPGFALSVLIELFDLAGLGGVLGDPPTRWEAIKDVMNTNAIPVLFVAIERRLAARAGGPPRVIERRRGERRG